MLGFLADSLYANFANDRDAGVPLNCGMCVVRYESVWRIA